MPFSWIGSQFINNVNYLQNKLYIKYVSNCFPLWNLVGWPYNFLILNLFYLYDKKLQVKKIIYQNLPDPKIPLIELLYS